MMNKWIKDFFKVEIQKQEWKLVLLCWIGIGLAILIPFLYGYLRTPPGSTFTAVHSLNTADTFVYYSNIQQAKEGQILLKNLYTSEAHQGLVRPLWFSLGFFVKIFNLSSVVIFQIAKFVLAGAFLFFAYIFISYFFKNKIKRKLGLIILAFSGGLGYLLPFSLSRKFLPIDLWIPESITFQSIYQSPHFILSMLSIMLIFFLMSLYFKYDKIKYGIFAGFLALNLGFFHPFDVVIITAVLVGFLIALLFLKEKKIFSYIKKCLFLGMFFIPSILYYSFLLKSEEFKSFFNQNLLPSPTLVAWILGFGLVFVLAVVGFFYLAHSDKFGQQKYLFLVIWAVVPFILIYLPFTFQRRLSAGLHIPLAILAAEGLYFCWQSIKQKVRFVVLAFLSWILLFGLFSSTLGVIIQDFDLYHNWALYQEKFQIPIYLSQDFKEGTSWLKENAKDNLAVLTASENWWIPAFSTKQVFLGHGIQTANFQEKKEETHSFFKDNNNDTQKWNFLNKANIGYIFFELREEKKYDFNPEDKNYLKKVYKNNQIEIYRVKGFVRESEL